MTLRVPFLACAFLLGAASATTVTGGDWPGFRGPNRDGVSTETGLMKKWPEGGPKQVWTAKKLGTGWGTPSAADGMIFGIGQRDKKDGVWALKEADGSEVWFTKIADPANGLGGQTNGPASTPTYHNGKLYAVSADGTLACLDAKTGKAEWSKNYVKDFGGAVPKWGYSDSVLADGDKIICAPGGRNAAVVALSADKGAVKWKTDAGETTDPKGKKVSGQGYSCPVKANVGGVAQYVVLLGNGPGIVGVHAETGKVLWRYNGVGASGSTAQIPTPVVKGDLVWVSCSYDPPGAGSALLQIVAKGKDAFEAKVVTTYKKAEANNHHGGMVLVGDYIYFGHDQNQGNPICIEFKTGAIKWGPEKSPAGGSGSAATLYADGRLYFRYQNGTMVLIEPSPDSLKVVSSFKLPAPDQKSFPASWPHPVIVNGKLYLRDQTVMYCYDVKAAGN